MRKTLRDMLKQIGIRGAYGSELGDDDASVEMLTKCVDLGLVKCEQSRVDDFFYLTAAGKSELRRH